MAVIKHSTNIFGDMIHNYTTEDKNCNKRQLLLGCTVIQGDKVYAQFRINNTNTKLGANISETVRLSSYWNTSDLGLQ